MTPALRIVLGALLLVFGRSLYWIVVGLAGFLAGLAFAERLLPNWSPTARFLVAIGAGIVGIVLAIFLQRVAFALLGFYGGAFVALTAVQSSGSHDVHLAAFVIGGVIGAIVAAVFMDWAIIVLTSLAGAAAIVTSFSIRPGMQLLVFVILAAVGTAIQAATYRRPARS